MLADDTEVLGSDYVVELSQTYISSMNVMNECRRNELHEYKYKDKAKRNKLQMKPIMKQNRLHNNTRPTANTNAEQHHFNSKCQYCRKITLVCNGVNQL